MLPSAGKEEEERGKLIADTQGLALKHPRDLESENINWLQQGQGQFQTASRDALCPIRVCVRKIYLAVIWSCFLPRFISCARHICGRQRE